MSFSSGFAEQIARKMLGEPQAEDPSLDVRRYVDDEIEKTYIIYCEKKPRYVLKYSPESCLVTLPAGESATMPKSCTHS